MRRWCCRRCRWCGCRSRGEALLAGRHRDQADEAAAMDELPAEQPPGVPPPPLEPRRGIVFGRQRSAAHERGVVAGGAAILELVVIRIGLGVFVGIYVTDDTVDASERCL